MCLYGLQIKLVVVVVEVLFQKRVRGFHQVSKREKTFETTRLQAEWFYCFRAFGNLMKPEARVFEMTSPKKQYKIMQCCIFLIFLENALYACVICCIQSAFIVFVSFWFFANEATELRSEVDSAAEL